MSEFVKLIFIKRGLSEKYADTFNTEADPPNNMKVFLFVYQRTFRNFSPYVNSLIKYSSMLRRGFLVRSTCRSASVTFPDVITFNLQPILNLNTSV